MISRACFVTWTKNRADKPPLRAHDIGLVVVASLGIACDSSPTVSESPSDRTPLPRVLHSVAPSGWFEPAYSDSHTSRDGGLLS